MTEDYSAHCDEFGGRHIVGHGSTWQPVGGRDQLHRFIDPQALFTAAHALYFAGRWTCDRPVDASRLWTALRDALGVLPGSATAAGMGESAKEVTVMLSVDSEEMRNMLNQVRQLGERVQGLLESNNREVERRRSIEGAARNLRAAQTAYMADRGNDELGKAVGAAAVELDHVLNGDDA